MRIAVAGDWHGTAHWAAGRLMSLGERHPEIDTLVHVGDFGIWPDQSGDEYLQVLDRVAHRAGVDMLVVPGNHEDWGRLEAGWAANGGEPLALTEHITVLPRGHRFELGGRSFVALGGAPSVDFDLPHRVQGRTWWREEAITAGDVARTVAGGHAEIMLTHDAPGPPCATPQVGAIVGSNPFGWSDAALEYAAEGRRLVTEAFLGVAPKLLMHGHYHVRDSSTVELPGGRACRIESLADQGRAGNLVLLDLDTLTVEEYRTGSKRD